jgi:hypothetical protein
MIRYKLLTEEGSEENISNSQIGYLGSQSPPTSLVVFKLAPRTSKSKLLRDRFPLDQKSNIDGLLC